MVISFFNYFSKNIFSLASVWSSLTFSYYSFLNPFYCNAQFLYLLKMSENQSFSDISGGIEMEHWVKVGLLSCSFIYFKTATLD